MIDTISHLSASIDELSERVQALEKLLPDPVNSSNCTNSVSTENTINKSDILHELQAGVGITKGLKHVSESEKNIKSHKSPVFINGSSKKPVSSVSTCQEPPSATHKDKTWIMRNYTTGVITPDFLHEDDEIQLENCSKCTFVLGNKVCDVNIKNCSHVSVLCKSACGNARINGSVGCTIQFTDLVDVVNINTSDEIQIYLSTKTLEHTRIYTCASLSTCVLLPRSSEDNIFSESYIPHQFVSTLTPHGAITTPMQKMSRDPPPNSATVDCPIGWWTPRSFKPGERCVDIFEERMKSTGDKTKIYEIPESYTGPHLSSPPTLDEIHAMVDFFKKGGILPLRYAARIIIDAWRTFEKLSNLVEIETTSKITICGDIHGNFGGLLTIFEKNGWPSPQNQYLFNGDFVDRGSQSCEVILTLFALRALDPTAIHLARGNHETLDMNVRYGFFTELAKKYHVSLQSLFTEVFCYLPIAHIVTNNTFVVHGGICYKHLNSTDASHSFKDEINKIDRLVPIPSEGDFTDLLWSDPCEKMGVVPSPRGTGHFFGPDITKAFLKQTGLGFVIRSHVPKPLGYEIHHDGTLATVFSSPNYEGNDNMGAFIILKEPYYNPEFVSFSCDPAQSKIKQ